MIITSMRISVITPLHILFLFIFIGVCSGLPFNIVETNANYVQRIIDDAYKNILLPTNHNVISTYIQSFLKETWNIDNAPTYFSISNRELYLFVSSQQTNFSIKRLPVPLIEGIETLVSFAFGNYLSKFRKFGVAEFGDTKILGLWYSDNAYLLIYVSQNTILRVDYWLSEKGGDIMIWSYLCAYDEKKVEKKFSLSGILLNIQSKEFYKFDFVERK